MLGKTPISFSSFLSFFFFIFSFPFHFSFISSMNSFLFFSFSHIFFFSLFSSHILFLFLFCFSCPLFGSSLTELVKEGNFLPLSSCHLSPPQIFFLISLFILFLYCIIHHVANYEPHIQVDYMALAMCHSLWVPSGIPLTMPCVIRHATPRKICNSDYLGIRQNSTWWLDFVRRIQW